MKRWRRFGFVAAAVFLSAVAQAETIDVQVKTATPEFWLDAQGYTHLNVKGFFKIGRPGQPELPVALQQVLLPPGHRIEAVSVVTGEAIELPGNVRAFVADMYQNAGADYVLFAGDADRSNVGGETQAPLVPVRGLCCNLDGYIQDDTIPSDLYYAALDGTFNSDGDTCWG